MRKKLGEEELHKLLELLKERLRPFLEKSLLLILDSTGIPQRGKTQELKWMRGGFPRVVPGHARPCLAIRYSQEEKLLLPVGMSVGEGYAPDPLLGAKALNAANPEGLLLADAGFDSGKVYEEAQGKYIQMIQLKGGGKVRDPRRKGGPSPCGVLCAAGMSGLIPLAFKSPLFQVNKKGHPRLFLDKPTCS